MVGGARRLGRTIALDLARHGADVAVSSRAATAEAAATCAEIRALGRRGAAVTGDVATPTGAAALVEAAAAALDGLEALVYTASGPFRPAPPQDIDPRDWQVSFDVVTRGFFVAACAARARFAGGASDAPPNADFAPNTDSAQEVGPAPPAIRGVIVALTDVLGSVPSGAFAAHGAAKAAQIMLVASLAKAWAGDGVRVCGIAPGPVDLPDDPRREATLRAAAQSPGGRPVAPAEIARAVRFVIACDALTGVNLPVDGGWLLGRAF